MKETQYKCKASGIYDGNERLTDFGARLVQETEIYGQTGFVRTEYEIKTKRASRGCKTGKTDNLGLDRGTWVPELVGPPSQVLRADYKKRVLPALLEGSAASMRLVRRFCSPGFQTIEGRPVYVHGGGVLAPSGESLDDVEAALPDVFANYGFPDPSTDEGERADYLRAPLDLLTVSKKNPAAGVIALGSAVRAVLCEFHPSAVTPILLGDSGAGKSELMAQATNCFRPGTDVNSLPFNLTSTSRGLRQRAAESAHMLFPVDDYYPTPGKRSDDETFVEMLIWGGSTTAGRQTAKSATEAESASGIETVVMLTAEIALVTDKDSRHARALYCELDRDDVDPKRRAACLDHARNGDLARAMREFIIGCLSRFEQFKDSVPRRFEHYQQKAAKALPDFHRRYWANVADIMVGVHYYLVFCREEGVIDAKRFEDLRGRSWEALIALAKAQATLVDRYSPENVVARAFEQLLRQGIYHLVQPRTDAHPRDVPAERVGWVDGRPRGECLGYVDAAAQKVYVPSSIDTFALYGALPAVARRMLPRERNAFWKRMVDHGIVQPGESGHNSIKVKRLGEGRFYRLHLPGLFR